LTNANTDLILCFVSNFTVSLNLKTGSKHISKLRLLQQKHYALTLSVYWLFTEIYTLPMTLVNR